MDRRVFVVVTGPDRSPQPMETVDRVFMMVPLLTPRGPSHTQQSGAFPRLGRLLFFLRCPACLLSFLPFLPFLLNFSHSNAERQMIFEASSFSHAKKLPNVSLMFSYREEESQNAFGERHRYLTGSFIFRAFSTNRV